MGSWSEISKFVLTFVVRSIVHRTSTDYESKIIISLFAFSDRKHITWQYFRQNKSFRVSASELPYICHSSSGLLDIGDQTNWRLAQILRDREIMIYNSVPRRSIQLSGVIITLQVLLLLNLLLSFTLTCAVP